MWATSALRELSSHSGAPPSLWLQTLNHVVHIAAVTQIRHPHSPGRAFYDRKRDEGMTGRSALRALKRRISDVIYRHLVDDAARRT